MSSSDKLTIASGSTTSMGTVTVTANGNVVDSPDKSVTVSGTVSGGRGVAAPSSVTLTLEDDEALPTVALALSSSSVSESGGVSTVTATLSGASSEAVTVTVGAAAGAGADADDFTLSSSDELTIAAGSTTSASTVAVTVTANGNVVDSPDKSVTVSGTVSGGNGVAAPSSVTLTLEDDEALPTVTLGLSSSSVSESGGVSTVTATLSGASSEAVTVTVGAAAGAGADADDFTLSSSDELTIAAGSTTSASTVTVTVTANGNVVDSPDKSVTVSGTVSGGNGVAAPSSVTLTLEDDEALPTVALALSSSSVSESGGVSTVTATLSGASSEAVTVTVGAAAGAGADADDFTLSSSDKLTIAAGSTTSASTVAVTVTANGNVVDSPDKSVTVSGTVSGGNGVAAPSSVTLTLEDDEALPTVALALSSSSVSESGGVSTVTATLSGASSEAVTVTVGAAAGAGADADDFTLSSSDKLTIASGSTTSMGTVTVTANGNVVDSPDKSVTVSGTVSGGNGVAAPSSVTLTLEDDEALPTVALALSPSSVSESGGVSTVTATLSGASSEAVTVTVGAAAGAGADADDFTLSSSDKLTIAAGSTTSASTVAVTVTANGNTVDSPDKSVTVSGTVSGGNGVAAPSSVTLTLEDDEALPTVTLALSSATIDESGTSNAATVTATLSGVSSAAVTVTVSATPGAGTATGDYMLSANKALTIASGATTSTGTVSITAVDNNDDEPNKSVAVSGAASGGNGVGNPTGKTLTIRDDEGPPTVTLVLSSTSVSENGGVSTVTATLNRASSASTTITVSAAPGTNTAAGNYMLSANKTLTIASGATTSAGAVTVTAVNDTTDSPDKSVTVSGSASNSMGVTQPSAVTLTITDDEAAPGVTLSVASSSIPENGGSTRVSAVLSHPSSASTAVTVTAVSGLYTVGSDATITIAAGETAAGGDTAAITAVNDDVDNASNRSGTVTGTAANSQGVGAVTGATLTLADDDTAGFTVSPTPSTSLRLRTTESGGTASFTVALSSEPTGDVRLGVASSNTAEGTVSPSSLTFDATNWDSAQTVSLTGVDDAPANPADGNKNYTVTLTVDTANTADTKYGALSVVDVYAVNADNEYGLDVSAVTGQPTEDGGTATFTVALVTEPSAAVTVSVTSRDTSGNLDASEGRASPSSLTFNAGNWNLAQTVTVTGVDDAIDDGDVTWAVRLETSSVGDANYNGLDDVNLSMTTTDNDNAPRVSLSLSPSSVSENGGAATVTAVLSHTSSAATTVTVTAAAVSGFYTVGLDATITIAAGVTANASDTATVLAVDDAIDNAGDRRVTVTGTAVNARATAESMTVTVSGATLTLLDDDMAGFVFEPSGSLTVAAGGAASTYTAELSSEPTGAVTVSIASDNGDVTVDPSSLTFDADNWGTAQTVTVTAAADGDDFADTATLSHRGEGGGYDGVTGALSAAVAGGGARIAASGGGSGTPRVYVVNGHLVTVTEEAGVPPGVEIDLASSNLAEDVSVTFKPVDEKDTPQESGSFSLAHSDARAMVDVDVTPAPKDGVKLCLTPPAGMREAARRASGRDVELLHYTGGSWTAVAGSTWDESRSQVCGTVTTFSDFSAGYARTKPVFEATQPALVFTVDETIDPAVMLPAATGGDGTLLYALTPALPPGLAFDEMSRTLSGTPTEAFDRTTYSLMATDRDGDETAPLRFTIEVKPALAEARARLKRINESVLPELSRAMWGVAVEAVTGRLENSGPGEGLEASLAQALRAQARDGAQEAREEERSWRRKTRERTQEEKLSWRKALEGRTFVLGLGASGEGGDGNGGSGYGGAVVWGGGTLRSLSLDKPELDWSGELFSAHMGVDAPLGERLRGGVAATWSEGEIAYTDRSGDEAIAGVHESRMTTVHPYAGWSGPDGSLAWGTLGYGKGEIEISDAEVVDRFGVQTSDSAFLGAALGGSIPVLSAGGLTLSLRGSGEATRYSVEDNGEAIAAVSVDTRRLRLSVQGSRRYALGGGGTLTPSLEAGGRWDGGDGETGAGLELGGGLEWTLPSGLSVEARGRTLAAHAGDAKEWGVSGSARLSPGADGRGLSFELAPRWGASESGLGRLWEDGATGRASPVGGAARLRLDTELGYGYGVRGGVLTPYGGFGYEQGGARRYRLGMRLDLGDAIDLGLEAQREEGGLDTDHGIAVELRIRW